MTEFVVRNSALNPDRYEKSLVSTFRLNPVLVYATPFSALVKP